MSQVLSNESFERRLQLLAIDYYHFAYRRGGFAGGRQTLLKNSWRAFREHRRRWWLWEWRWWWLQQLNRRSVRHQNRTEADGRLAFQLALTCGELRASIERVELGDVHSHWNSGGEPAVVSIVMPVYNHRAFVVQAIESLFSQTYPYWELILVDDGSDDQLDAVLGPYRGHDRIGIYHCPHRGLPAALNFGFDRARGDFLTWTSADNWLHPTCLTRLVEFLNRRPDVQGVYSNYLLVDERGEPFRRPVAGFYDNFIHPNQVQLATDVSRLNISHNFIGASFLYRRLLAKVVGQYSNQLGVEDYDFFMRANSLFKLAHLDSDDALYSYRFHSNSLTGANHQGRRLNRRVADLQRYDAVIREPIYQLPVMVQPYQSRLTFTDGVIWVVVVAIASRRDIQQLRELKRGQQIVVIADVQLGDCTDLLAQIANNSDWIIRRQDNTLERDRLSTKILINPNPDWQSPFIKTLAYTTVAQRYQ